MEQHAKIFVAGSNGMVGSAICRALKAQGYSNIITKSHSELDLLRQSDVEAFFASEKPDYVFHAAARVGGISVNARRPADFLYENMMIGANVVKAAFDTGVRKLIALGSSCIYPRMAPQPMREEHLLTGPLEPTNEGYALAKIALLRLCAFYRRQYGADFISVMPTNLYGINDNYHPEDSHVLPALLRRMHEAKCAGAPQITVWGSGNALREFLYADDLADACVYLMNTYSGEETVNVGSGIELSIRELAEKIRDTVGYKGELVFDPTRPDGTPRKLLDISKLTALGWHATTSLEDGLKRTYEDFLHHGQRGNRR